MKSLIVLLAVVCAAFASVLEREKRQVPPVNVEALKNTCPGRCVFQDKYREWLTQLGPKAREWSQGLGENTEASQVIPTLHPEKWDTYCTELNSIRTCIAACSEPSDAENKQKAGAILNAAKDIVCDNDIKTNYNCLAEVGRTPSPTCNTQCESFKAAVVTAHNEYKTTGRGDLAKLKAAAQSACKLVNCRLVCRKSDITTKCQQAGYDAAKKTVRSLSNLVQTTHAQFRPAENFPDECKADQLLQGA